MFNLSTVLLAAFTNESQMTIKLVKFNKLLIAILTSHHHLAEFIKVHGSGAVFIELINDSIQLLVSEGGEQLSDQGSQGLVGDEALVVLVVKPESVLELSLHGLNVRVLHQEGGAQLTELSELDLSGAVLINLEQQLLELLLGGSEAHGPHDLAEVISREEILLLGVEKIKANLQALDLVVGQVGLVIDLLEVNVGVGIGLGHDEGVLSFKGLE